MTAHETHQDANLTASPAEVASVPTVDAAAVLVRHTLAPSGSLLHARICAACYWPWRGNAETGGCETVLLAHEVVALRERAETAEGLLTTCRARFDVASDAPLRMDARVALLKGLLRLLIAALVVDFGGWYECDACTGTWRRTTVPLHEDGCPVPPAIAALAQPS